MDPQWAAAGFHQGVYHTEPHPSRGASEGGAARVDLPRDARVRVPLRHGTRNDGRDVRGGVYMTLDHPQRLGKKVQPTDGNPW